MRILFVGGMRASQPIGRELLLRLANHIMTGVTVRDFEMMSMLNKATLVFVPGIDRSFHLVDSKLLH
jgi:hypothetical protein